MILKRNPIKAQQGRVLSPQGDPYEYLADEAGNYYARKRGSNSWNKASGNAASAIGKLYGNKPAPAPAPAVQPEEEEGGSSFGDLWNSAVDIFSSKTPEEKEAEERERVAQRQAELKSIENDMDPNWINAGLRAIKEGAQGSLPASAEGVGKYMLNALAQGYGLTGQNESFVDLNTTDFTNAELDQFRQAAINALERHPNKPHISTYMDYSNVDNGKDDMWAQYRSKGSSGALAGGEPIRNAMTIGRANLWKDEDGNIWIGDDYDLYKKSDRAKEAVKEGKQGVTLGELYDIAKERWSKSKDIWDFVHGVTEDVNSTMPANINLGKGSDFLTPEQIELISSKPMTSKTRSLVPFDFSLRDGLYVDPAFKQTIKTGWNSLFDNKQGEW